MPCAITTIGIDTGKNTFHLVGLDQRGSIVLQLKTSRAQLERRLANVPRSLIGMEACSGAHYIYTALSDKGVALISGTFGLISDCACACAPARARSG
jgi:transposase